MVGVPDEYRMKILENCGKEKSPLEVRLAAAWVLQKINRKWHKDKILDFIRERPWINQKWWYKERNEMALVQICSRLNQKRRYYGWDTIRYISGGNIANYLTICGEIWDAAAKQGIHPIHEGNIDEKVQTEGILKASIIWKERDRNESRGGRRYFVLNNLGAAIRDSIAEDLAMSNPGHTGFSISESDLYETEKGEKVKSFLQNSVSWGVLEERRHKSNTGIKQQE